MLKIELHFEDEVMVKIFKLYELIGGGMISLHEIPEGIVIRNIDREIENAEKKAHRK